MSDEITWPEGLSDEDIAAAAADPASHSVGPNGRTVTQRSLKELLEAREMIRVQTAPKIARFRARIL